MNTKICKKLFLILLFLIISLVILFLFTNETYAVGNLIKYKPTISGMPDIVKTKTETILGIVQVAGSIIAVIVLVVIGIKFVIGSAEEKAEYKKSLLPYLVGAIFLFTSSNLVSVIYNFAKDINN